MISWDKVRTICIQNNLYTNGSNTEYQRLFNLIEKGLLSNIDIAQNVYIRSVNVTYSQVLELFK